MGPLKSGHGRMEMPYLVKGLWDPFPALLPNLTKVSEESPIWTAHILLLGLLGYPVYSSRYLPPWLQASSRRNVCPLSVKRAAS